MWLATNLVLFILAPVALLIVVSLLQPILARREDSTPDCCWKKDGIYYVNRADPALFVEKRVGVGYTPNFGNPWSWVLLTVVTFVSMAPIILPFEYLRIHH
jgi:uncharacterized membrane protein